MDLEATLQFRELVPEDRLRAEVMDSRLRKSRKVAVERKGGANRKVEKGTLCFEKKAPFDYGGKYKE